MTDETRRLMLALQLKMISQDRAVCSQSYVIGKAVALLAREMGVK
jgi:hypothetical protein